MARDYARSNRRSSRDTEGGHNWRWPLAGILIVLFALGIFYLKQQSDKLAAQQGDEGASAVQRTMKQNNNREETTQRPLIPNKTLPTGKSTQPPATQPAPTPQPKFDFYTMLPKGQAATANMPVKTTPPPPPVATVPVTPPTPVAKPAITTVAKAPVNKQPSTQQLEKSAQADTSDLIAAEIEKLNDENNKSVKTKPVATAKTATHYTLQLGIFKNYNDADQLKAQMVLQGFEVSIKNFKKENNTLYRVYMGSYPSFASAKKQQHLLEENQIKSKITKE